MLREESGKVYPVWVRVALGLLQCWLVVYDYLAYIPFLLFANPQEKLEKAHRIKAKPTVEGDPSSPWRSVDCPGGQLKTRVFPDCDTVGKQWKRAVTFYSVGLGTREVLSVEQEVQKSGKTFEKWQMGAYKWQSFADVAKRVRNVGSGLVTTGLKKKNRVVIFCETRADWMITALACFDRGYELATVYSTLGEDAIVHAINETEATTIFTSQELVPKVVSIYPQCARLTRCVYYTSLMPDPEPLNVSAADLSHHGASLTLQTFADLERVGEEADIEPVGSVESTDVAVVMYTSGTTGLPKGVLMTHANLVSAAAGQCAMIPGLGYGDVFIGYLPQAHILELAAEISCLANGVAIGYSSPNTLHDQASKIKRGTKGDCSVLQPTLMAAVPAIMDRIHKAVKDKVAASPPLRQALFHFLYQRKRAKIETGYDNPFLNRLVFSHIRAILGGRIRLMLSGGAPLSPETERFMNICFCCPVGQGYGLTETIGAGTISSADNLTPGVVGAPLPCCEIMLRNWEEGGYKATNKPHPQGEILISGGNVALGYLKSPEKTAEAFITMNGKKWFCTGDIGEFLADGNLRIIDRKKDLVKLSHGEYVSLGKVETALLTSPLVDNICVYGDSKEAFIVSLVVPNKPALDKLAAKVGVTSTGLEELCGNKEVVGAFLKELQSLARQNRLEKMETPQKLHLCSEVWTPASGLLTEALKLKRVPIAKLYASTLKSLYT